MYFSRMTLAVVIAILAIGLLLVFLELFLIPGTTLFGVIGGVALIIGIIMVYMYYGNKWGNLTTGTVFVLVIICVIAGFKVIQSNSLAMKAEITSKVNVLEKDLYTVGNSGITASELRPGGKALFNGNRIEVFSMGEYIPRDIPIEIIKITNDKIFVNPVKL